MVITKTMLRVISVILACILAGGILALTACSNENQTLRVGATAPDFSLKDLSGQSVSPSTYKGKTILITFWETSCQPCVDEMPALQGIYNDLSAKNNFTILMINAGEDASIVKTFMQKNNFSFPVLLDPHLEAVEKYNVSYTPTSILIGPDGKVEFSIICAFKNRDAIEKQIAGYIN